MAKNKVDEKYVSIVEAARYFGIGRDKLRQLVKTDSTIPILYIGKNVKINLCLMEEWLEEKVEKREVI